MSDIDAIAARVVRCLEQTRCNLSDEKQTQADVATALAVLKIPFAREARLAPGEVVDFLVEGAIALEVKLNRARPRDVLAQLARYAAHDRVKVLILVTNRAMTLPKAIGGKPAFYLSLGRAWL